MFELDIEMINARADEIIEEHFQAKSAIEAKPHSVNFTQEEKVFMQKLFA